jgi:hypothetical protein
VRDRGSRRAAESGLPESGAAREKKSKGARGKEKESCSRADRTVTSRLSARRRDGMGREDGGGR